ncbi:MAG TPA: tripartite tricarboxylate transporter substrate binding protein, partial [Arenibaculum sp.]|nr:tripartite tricarboxylate transporter substrate binding protein [Arenibaculum sp.]
MNRPLLAIIALAAMAAISVAPAVRAQAYPSKPVRIVAPVQPGGGVDLVGRTVAEQLSKSMNATFVVETLAGGGGVIASRTVANAAPDGYTLMVGYVATHGTNPAVRKVPYDAVRDFTPVAMVGGTPNVLVVNPSTPAKDLKEFVEFAKKNPGKLSYGSAGQGSLTHLAMEQFKVAAGFDAVHAAYRGIGPAITDLLGAQTQLMMPGLAAALPHIKAGKMSPIAVTGLKRHPLLPDVPTFEEQGYHGFDGVQWYGIVGPAGIPPGITRQLNAEINKALSDP